MSTLRVTGETQITSYVASPLALGQRLRNHQKHCATSGGIVFFHHIRNVGWVDAH
jgi:hypothetical protein